MSDANSVAGQVVGSGQTAEPGTMVTVEWGNEHYAPFPYHGVDTGVLRVTAPTRPGSRSPRRRSASTRSSPRRRAPALLRLVVHLRAEELPERLRPADLHAAQPLVLEERRVHRAPAGAEFT